MKLMAALCGFKIKENDENFDTNSFIFKHLVLFI